MTKYAPLSRYLGLQSSQQIVLTFTEIEKILGADLPRSAATYPEWWANETNPESTHTQCRAWLAAGYKAYPDIASNIVRFTRLT
jgi:hypothetical protein